jgi:hypothetical protein
MEDEAGGIRDLLATGRIVIVLCASAFARAMVSLPPEEIFSLCHYHNGPSVPRPLDEDTIFLRFEGLGNSFLSGLSPQTNLVANRAVSSPSLKDTPPCSAFTGLWRCVQ